MRRIFRRGFREYEFFNSRETRFVEFHSRHDALEFLAGFTHDAYSMTYLRRLLERELFNVNLAAYHDQAVLSQLADLLVAKEIRVVERYDLFEAGFHTVNTPQEAVSAPAPLELVDEQEEPEVPELPPAPLPVGQVAALVKAAAAGAPFCEA